MKRFIYADNAATTKLDSDALNEMLPWLQDEYGNASQPYTFARKPRKALSEARTTIASCIALSRRKSILPPAAPKAITGLSKVCLDMMTAEQLLPARSSIMRYYTPANP